MRFRLALAAAAVVALATVPARAQKPKSMTSEYSPYEKETIKRMQDHGTDVETGTPEQLGALVKSELAKWKGVVQRGRLTAE